MADRPLRIVHVAGSAEWGGGERYLELLARYLDRDRFALAVVLPGPGPFADRLERLAVPHRVADLTRLVSPAAIVRLAATLRPLAPHVVQSHGARSNFYGRLATALLPRARHISTVHNSLSDYPVSRPRYLLYRAMDRLTLPLTRSVLCVGAALAREYGARATVIPNGVEVVTDGAGRVREAARHRLGLGEGPVVGFAGRLTPQKDPTTFLRALAGVRRELPAVRGVIVGDGPLRTSLEREADRLGIAERCLFAGFRPDASTLLSALDVFVLSSRSEGLPFIVLEAMAAGVPIVATAVSGVPELVEANVSGILVSPADPEAMGRAVLDLLRWPERARALGAAARARVTERFNVADMIQATARLYLKIAAP